MSRYRLQRHYHDWTVEPDDADPFVVELTFTISPYDPGVRSGPPEDCYPPEGGEVEILSVLRDGKEFELDDSELELARIWLEENFCAEDGDYD